MVHMTTKIERQLKRKGGSHPSQLLGSLSPWKLNFKANMGGCPIFTEYGVDIRDSKREGISSPIVEVKLKLVSYNYDIKCFYCFKVRHIAF